MHFLPMDELPDVLDAMGRTPREFGSVHVHFEGYRLVDGRRGVALVLAQAAFVPCAGAVVRVLEGVTELASAALPPLNEGEVVRRHLPILKASDVDQLTLRVEASEPEPRARRVRPAWKLHDTFEIPRLSEMEPVSADGGMDLMGSLAISAVTGPLLGAVVLRDADGGATLPANTHSLVHPSRGAAAVDGGEARGWLAPSSAPRKQRCGASAIESRRHHPWCRGSSRNPRRPRRRAGAARAASRDPQPNTSAHGIARVATSPSY
jgi:hypothetical protein